jgi:hypothetical protein
MRYFSHGVGTGNMLWNLSVPLPILVMGLFALSANLDKSQNGIPEPNVGAEDQILLNYAPLACNRLSASKHLSL